MPAALNDYTALGVIVLAGLVLAGGMLGLNRLLRPVAPSEQKALSYESGVDPEGRGWAQAHIRYYVYAFLYVVFAVDAVFLFPWSVVLDELGAKAAVEMAVFLATLAVGLAYAWRKGVLSWTTDRR